MGWFVIREWLVGQASAGSALSNASSTATTRCPAAARKDAAIEAR